MEHCNTENHKITITPTIPVRRTIRGLPRITFAAPPGVDILDSSCEVTLLEGITPVTVIVKAACNQDGVTEGLKPIIPRISHVNSLFWHPNTVSFPKIWVCTLMTE